MSTCVRKKVGWSVFLGGPTAVAKRNQAKSRRVLERPKQAAIRKYRIINQQENLPFLANLVVQIIINTVKFQ